MNIPGRNSKVFLAGSLEAQETVKNIVDGGLGNGLARPSGDGELRIVERDSGAGLVERWEERGRRVGYGESDAVAVFESIIWWVGGIVKLVEHSTYLPMSTTAWR